nr:phosphatase PAP2 family protein [Neobacillus sp. Marseille-Q6967]
MQRKNKGDLISVGCLLLAIIVAIYISTSIVNKQIIWFDEKLALLANLPDSINPFFLFITELGDKLGIGIVAVIVLIWLLIKRNFLGAAILALSVAIGNELNKFLKVMFARERPDLDHLAHVDSLSFPSGHAMVGLVFYYMIAYFMIERMTSTAGKRVVIILTALMLILIGASRIILQVHYPSDVIGGFAFGYIWVFIWILLYKYIKKFKLKRRG